MTAHPRTIKLSFGQNAQPYRILIDRDFAAPATDAAIGGSRNDRYSAAFAAACALSRSCFITSLFSAPR
jgi:hypothetical protein